MIDYSAYCAAVGVKPRQIVSVVSDEFPRFSKIQFSMCSNPAYGVCMRPEAEELVIKAFGQPEEDKAEDKHRYPENRKKANCFRVRLDDESAERVRKMMGELHFSNVQSFLEWVLLTMLDGRASA